MATTISGTAGVTFPAGGVGNPASAVVGLTDTQTLTNKTLTSPTITGAAVSSMASSVITSGTAQTAPPATPQYFDFTSIPSWVKRITVMFSGVSTNSTSNYLIQIGDSGGIENTGYTSVAQTDGGSSGVLTTGFAVLYAATAASLHYGRIEISLITGTTWVASGVAGNNGGNVSAMYGNKSLSDVLDRVRITTVNGTDTFDAGTINIMYE